MRVGKIISNRHNLTYVQVRRDNKDKDMDKGMHKNKNKNMDKDGSDKERYSIVTGSSLFAKNLHCYLYHCPQQQDLSAPTIFNETLSHSLPSPTVKPRVLTYRGIDFQKKTGDGFGSVEWFSSSSSSSSSSSIETKTRYRYVGYFVNNLCHGYGILYRIQQRPQPQPPHGNSNGNSNVKLYSGEWKHGLRDGYGMAWYDSASDNNDDHNNNQEDETSQPQGTYYEGRWKEGLWNGNGRLVTKVASYHGGFRNGRFHGFGICVRRQAVLSDVNLNVNVNDNVNNNDNVNDNVDVFVGNSQEGVAHGRGFVSRSGEKYWGDFWNNLRHGHRTVVYPDQSVYSGPWIHDRPEGPHGVLLASRQCP